MHGIHNLFACFSKAHRSSTLQSSGCVRTFRALVQTTLKWKERGFLSMRILGLE